MTSGYGPAGNIISSPPDTVVSTLYPAAVTPPDPEPPFQVATRPWMGSSAPEGLTGFARLENQIVKRKLEVRRVFSPGFVADPTGLINPDVEAGRVPVYSLKEPSGDTASRTAQWTTFANNINTKLQGFAVIILNHEPENDTGYTVEQWVTDFTLFYNTVKPIIGNKAWLAPCIMGVTTYSAARAPWWNALDTLPMDCLCVDAYNQLNRRSFTQIFDKVRAKAASRTDLAAGGIPWGVTEVSTHGTDDEREVWIRGAQNYWEKPENASLKFVIWYDSDLGDNAAFVGWRLERALPDGWYPQEIPGKPAGKLYARAKPSDVALGIEWVTDLKSPAAYNAAMNTPRRAFGSAGAPPVEPPEPPPFGALPLGGTNYPIPTTGKVVYTDPNGNDLAAGGLLTPVKKLTQALTMFPPNGGTIVMRAGDYPVDNAVGPWRVGPITIQAYPGEEVWWVGSEPVTGWIKDTTGPGGIDRWRKNNWVTNFDRTPQTPEIVDPAWPEAPWPEQVWIDDVPLQQVSTLAAVDGTAPDEATAPGTFWYDTVGRVMWIGSTPFNKTVRIAVRQLALSGTQDAEQGNPRIDLLGIGVKHYATSSKQVAAVRLFANDTLVENCHFVENSTDGIFHHTGSNVRLLHNTFERNGRLGGHGYKAPGAELAYNRFYKNNRKMHETQQLAGGGKWDTGGVGMMVHHNQVEDNWGHGIWLDIGCHLSAMWANECIDQTHGFGLFYELSTHGLIVGNYFENSAFGLQVGGCADMEIWNNTFANCTEALRLRRDDRPDLPQYLPYNWEQKRFLLRNNVFSQDVTNAAAIMWAWWDAQGGTEDWDEADVDSDFNAYYFKVRSTAATAKLTIPGTTTWTAYGTLANLQAATTLDDNSIGVYENATNPYLETDLRTPKTPIIETGTAVPEKVRIRFSVPISAEEAATPNRGAF